MPTIGEVIEQLRGSAPPIEGSVDVLETGHQDTEVTGIATAFMATQSIVERAAELGANLLISHEGIYYSHRMPSGPLPSDPVYQTKSAWIDHAGLAIYRHHDYCHRSEPDLIMTGLLHSLGWEEYVEEMLPTAAVLRIPEAKASDIAVQVRERLDIPFVRLAGDADMACRRVGVLVGYRGGGDNAIPLFREKGLDLILAGEGPEWETPEYARDSAYQGVSRSFLLLGHAESEEPGMRLLADRLQSLYPYLPVRFLKGEPAFRVFTG
ncbi:Nif3-like dinuclear metal center hexameric protein [Cohnella sp. AR92]|uniref:Nif3-like dinuclear metal center hexameric protein n=1 Tax=Cohnella sp. AR92 TaxID=648716 RepID=UPI000F8E9EAD|nr:Nif3-like dinuclear metal center hexameric protein [Cohnella sp. AR92]RUS45719.1 transcriptional regulator [Cohnella sp. AR92]